MHMHMAIILLGMALSIALARRPLFAFHSGTWLAPRGTGERKWVVQIQVVSKAVPRCALALV